jgi:hypothetical protein
MRFEKKGTVATMVDFVDRKHGAMPHADEHPFLMRAEPNPEAFVAYSGLGGSRGRILNPGRQRLR